MDGGGTTSPASKVVLFARPGGVLRTTLASLAGVVPAASGFEAAAEMLAGPTAVLVVDLGVLTSPHLRLLRLADELGVAALGVGAVCAGLRGEPLHGLRAVGVENVLQEVQAACREFEESMRSLESDEAPPLGAVSSGPPLGPVAPESFQPAGVSGPKAPASVPPPRPAAEPASPGQMPPATANPFLVGAAAAAEMEEELAGNDELGRYVRQAPSSEHSPAPAPSPAPSKPAPPTEPPARPSPPTPPADRPAEPASLLTAEELSALLEDEP